MIVLSTSASSGLMTSSRSASVSDGGDVQERDEPAGAWQSVLDKAQMGEVGELLNAQGTCYRAAASPVPGNEAG
ncbi:hypothetical protein [Streptomyces sp. NPDC060027]|uniref:hypothetical protein n=1 Tax=Streptomyces sp. NPDC060027 TaxID=3347040 RepID=UPI003694F8C0